MKLTTPGRAVPETRPETRSFQLPIYVVIPLYLSVCMIVITAGWVMLVRQDALPDPFSAYASLISGQPNAKMLCTDTMRQFGYEEIIIIPGQQCSSYPVAGLFSRVSIVEGDRSNWVYFAVRDRAVALGDLVLLWGKPSLQQLNQRITTLTWPDREISAWVRQSDGGRFNYFLSPVMVYFRSIPTNS